MLVIARHRGRRLGHLLSCIRLGRWGRRLKIKLQRHVVIAVVCGHLRCGLFGRIIKRAQIEIGSRVWRCRGLGIEVQIETIAQVRSVTALEQGLIRRDLLPHDDDAVPFSRRRLGQFRLHTARQLDELARLTGRKIHLGQLGLDVGPSRVGFHGLLQQQRGLVIQAIGQMEVSFSDGVVTADINHDGFGMELLRRLAGRRFYRPAGVSRCLRTGVEDRCRLQTERFRIRLHPLG